MARTNKYASINFNDIYEKKNINPATKKPSSAPSATLNSKNNHLSATRTHGGMLVLTRTSPKPQPQLQPQPKSQAPAPTPTPPKPADPIQTSIESDPFSLRPLGRIGTGSSPSPSPFLVSSVKEPATVLQPAKPEPFVPPHLRPGFVGREERVAQEGQRQQGFRHREFHGYNNHGSPGQYTKDGRPKSGGYERIRRGGGGGGDSDLPVNMNRPSSSGNGSSSGGWYGPYGQRSPANANHYFHHQQF